jgi:hypothetical protein
MPDVPKIGHFHVISKYHLGCHKCIFTPHNNQNNSNFLINNQILLKSNIVHTKIELDITTIIMVPKINGKFQIICMDFCKLNAMTTNTKSGV